MSTETHSRFFVDERGGIIAVRDRTLTDPEYQGLHPNTLGVVWSRMGDNSTGEWLLKADDVAYANEICGLLNRGVIAPVPSPDYHKFTISGREAVAWIEPGHEGGIIEVHVSGKVFDVFDGRAMEGHHEFGFVTPNYRPLPQSALDQIAATLQEKPKEAEKPSTPPPIEGVKFWSSVLESGQTLNLWFTVDRDGPPLNGDDGFYSAPDDVQPFDAGGGVICPADDYASGLLVSPHREKIEAFRDKVRAERASKPAAEDKPWKCQNPKCGMRYAEYVNGCPRCSTGDGNNWSVHHDHDIPAEERDTFDGEAGIVPAEASDSPDCDPVGELETRIEKRLKALESWRDLVCGVAEGHGKK